MDIRSLIAALGRIRDRIAAGITRVRNRNRWPSIPIIAWVILFAIAANLPFVNQPYHMDDGIYLMIARNVQHNPWFPQDFPLLFEGLYGPDLASTEHAWPLTSYFAALIACLGGFTEVGLHLGFVLFPVLIAWGMYSLSAELTRHPALATVSLLTLPVVAVLSHTLMTDIPLLAIWLTAVVLFRRGLASGSALLLWASSIVVTLACMVAYSGLCVVVLLIFYALLRRKPAAAVIMMLVPAGAFAALLVANYVHYHRFTPGMIVSSYLSAKRVFTPQLVLEKSVFVLLALGAVTVSPLLAILSNSHRVTLAMLAAAVALSLVLPRVSSYTWDQRTIFVVFCWTGLCLLIRVIGWTAKSLGNLWKHSEPMTEDLFLGLWALGVILFCVAAHMTGSARHLLPATPPLILILFRFIEQNRDRLSRRLAIGNLGLCMTVALALSLADFEFASIYRDFAETMSRSSPRQTRKLWFTGEWGFRAYLEQAGGRELGRRDGCAKPGDLLIVPTLATPYSTLYSDKLSLPSIVLVAPSSTSFAIPPIPSGSVMVYTIGMPFYQASDGMQFTVRFVSAGGDHVLSEERITPSTGRYWAMHELSLPETVRRGGTVVLEAGVGIGGNATADWVAVSRARIALREARVEETLYDFREKLNQAQIVPSTGIDYHTEGNVPVFPMDVWLEQASATILRSTHQYRPRLPVRLLDSGSRAGFWSSSWGLLPYAFDGRDNVLETISVYEVTREVDAYGERPGSWYEK